MSQGFAEIRPTESGRGSEGRQQKSGGLKANLNIPYPSPAGGYLSLANYRRLGVLRPAKK